MRKQFTIFLILIFAFLLFPALLNATTNSLAKKLVGKIILQVESRGEAYYINPVDLQPYYLGKPEDAFSVIKSFGLGISNKDFNSFNGKAPSRLSGRILLKVEDSGKAYYINPTDLTLNFLGKPADAYNLMRKVGVGISNKDFDLLMNNSISTQPLTKKLTNQEIIKKLKPAVVYIETTNGAGSGMILDKSGYILTNAHVVSGVDSATIDLYDGQSKTAKVIGRDEEKDIALLKIESGNYFSVSFADSDKAEPGEAVFALGFPFGIKGDVSFKDGTISRVLTVRFLEY